MNFDRERAFATHNTDLKLLASIRYTEHDIQGEHIFYNIQPRDNTTREAETILHTLLCIFVTDISQQRASYLALARILDFHGLAGGTTGAFKHGI
jgi:hypothetical protein